MSKAQKGNKEKKKPKADKNQSKANVSAYKAAQGQASRPATRSRKRPDGRCLQVSRPVFQSDLWWSGFARDFGRGRHENVSGAISWFTFFAGGPPTSGEAKGLEEGTHRNGNLFSVEAEQRSLLSPIGRQPRRPTHQCLGVELLGCRPSMMAVVMSGAQPGKTQKGIEVGCRDVLLASDRARSAWGSPSSAPGWRERDP